MPTLHKAYGNQRKVLPAGFISKSSLPSSWNSNVLNHYDLKYVHRQRSELRVKQVSYSKHIFNFELIISLHYYVEMKYLTARVSVIPCSFDRNMRKSCLSSLDFIISSIIHHTKLDFSARHDIMLYGTMLNVVVLIQYLLNVRCPFYFSV